MEEADETQLWLEFLGDTNIVPKSKLVSVEKEHLEILSILAIARKSSGR